MVDSTFSGSVVAKTKTRCSGGSSTIFSRALKPCGGDHVRLVDDEHPDSATRRARRTPGRAARGCRRRRRGSPRRARRRRCCRGRSGASATHDPHTPHGIGRRPLLAVQRAGQDARRRGLAAAARAGEQVGVVDPPGRQRDAQRLGDVLLPDHLGERRRTVLAVQSHGQRGYRAGPTGAPGAGPRVISARKQSLSDRMRAEITTPAAAATRWPPAARRWPARRRPATGPAWTGTSAPTECCGPAGLFDTGTPRRPR